MSMIQSSCLLPRLLHVALHGRQAFVLGSCSMTALEVGEMLRRWEPVFDLAVIGIGLGWAVALKLTLSSIPRLPGLSAEDIMAMLSQLTKNVMNVVSSTNNHVKFQRVFEAISATVRDSSVSSLHIAPWAALAPRGVADIDNGSFSVKLGGALSPRCSFLCEGILARTADPESERQQRPPHELPNGAVYEGQWVGPAREGYGIQKWPDGASYTGQWDKAQGMGKFHHAAGDWYEGNFLDDMQHGYGVAMYIDGSKYTGQFACDKHHGEGVEVWPDGSRFQGSYFQGMKHGNRPG
eukprot:s1288_g3.t1